MKILELLGLEKTEKTGEETETVRRIMSALDEMPKDQARYIAAFAYILSRVARADLSISPEETAAMEEIVMALGNLPADQAIVVVQMAKSQNLLFGGTANYLVTREFNEFATREQKLNLLNCLFAVSAADDNISTAEDSEIRQIASELLLEHREFIEVRSSFRDKLAVLKGKQE